MTVVEKDTQDTALKARYAFVTKTLMDSYIKKEQLRKKITGLERERRDIERELVRRQRERI